MKKKIVIIDDFEESCQLMAEILSNEFECYYICESSKALEFIKLKNPDIILMDYKMPYVTGVELCKIIKNIPELKKIPIIFISGAVSSDERIETLESGGDDFLSKPFHPKELLLRVRKRIIFNTESEDTNKKVLAIGNIKLNCNSHQCFVDSTEVMLTPKQYEILKLLIENKEKVVSREVFMSEIWGHVEVTSRNIDSQINYMKKKITGFNGHITSVSGYGYRIDDK